MSNAECGLNLGNHNAECGFSNMESTSAVGIRIAEPIIAHGSLLTAHSEQLIVFAISHELTAAPSRRTHELFHRCLAFRRDPLAPNDF